MITKRPEGPVSGRWSAEVSRALREALETVATQEVASRMLIEALTEARLSAPPEQHDDLESFVSGELTQVVTETLGQDAMPAVRARIDPVLRVLARVATAKSDGLRGARTTAPPSLVTSDPKQKRRDDETLAIKTGDAAKAAETEPGRKERATSPPLHASTTGRVVVVTPDVRLGSELRVRIGAAATVLTYRTLGELARSPLGAVHVMVLDVRDLPADFEISIQPSVLVLFPASAAQREQVSKRHATLKDIRYAGDDAGVDDLATVVRICFSG